jgi:DNA polymerase elongation subunit (family B)
MKGWLLDLYPSGPGEMTLWFILENGKRIKLIDRFQPRIYVVAVEQDLQRLTNTLYGSKSVAAWRFTQKYANASDLQKSAVLEIDVTDTRRIPFFARKILRMGGYQRFKLGNVDLPDAQRYLYDRDIFPLAFLEIRTLRKEINYRLLDSVQSEDYQKPPLRKMGLEVEVARAGKIPNLNDPIKEITLLNDDAEVHIDGRDEREKIVALAESIREMDPDIILTQGGDSTLFPYLARRISVE